MPSRLQQTLDDLKSRRQLGFLPFIPAGYPDLPTTRLALLAMQSNGADAIEIGFPFSDPIADGPTIQAAYTDALAHHIRVQDILDMVSSVRSDLRVPLIGMVSYSIVYRYGVTKFLANTKAAGFDALLIPDLPIPEAKDVCEATGQAGLDTILLIAPTTPPERRREIAALCTGFVYYLSVSGITGARQDLPADLAQNVGQLHALTGRPIYVGFGISRPDHMTALTGIADGAIVGSALVKRMTEKIADGPAAIAAAVGEYCRQLRG